MDSLTYSKYRKNTDHAWLVCYALIGATAGVIPWAFLTEKMGRKSTLLFQGPCLLICWFIKGYFNNYKVYTIAHGFSGFFGICYMFAGEAYLIETVHRHYMKTMFTVFRASFLLGVTIIATVGPLLGRMWLCVFGASLTVLCWLIMCILPESPVFLLPRSEPKADNALRYFLGKNNVSPELSVIRRCKVFLVSGTYNSSHLMSVKVVRKTIFIVCVLQIISTMTGYYVFILDGMRIFTTATSTAYANVVYAIFGTVLVLARLIGLKVNLRIPAGIKRPMILSTGLNSIILFSLGFIWYFKGAEQQMNAFLMLLVMCIYGIVYELSLSVCPDILLYDYSPYQIYDYLMKMTLVLHWALVTAAVCIHMLLNNYIDLHWLMWGMSFLSAAGCLFIVQFVIESKSKTLVQIQTELGGNPAGNRGSRHNRLASPYEQEHDYAYFQNLIRANLPQH